MIKHIQNFRGVENKEKNYWSSKMAKNTWGISKLQANRLHEDHLKKTHILHIVSILTLVIQNIVFSSLNFSQQPRNLGLNIDNRHFEFSSSTRIENAVLCTNFEYSQIKSSLHYLKYA